MFAHHRPKVPNADTGTPPLPGTVTVSLLEALVYYPSEQPLQLLLGFSLLCLVLT